MKRIFLLLSLLMMPVMNEKGAIGFGLERYNRRLMDEGTEGGGEGGEAGAPGKKEEKPGQSGTGGEGEGENLDVSTLPQAAQDLIKKLRKENGDRRTEANNLKTKEDKVKAALKLLSGEDDEEEPEVKLGKISEQLQSTQMRSAMLELAYEHGVPADQRDYFEFLMGKKLETLEEGEELDEDGLQEVLGKVKKKGTANTSTKGDGKGDPGKGPGASDGTTLDQFIAMGMAAKSKLYAEKPEVYASLMAEAKKKKLL